MDPAAVVIGRIGRPHGVRGAVRARGSGATLATLVPGQAVELRPTGGAPARTLVIAARAGTADEPILHFDGVDTREAAGALTNAEIAVPQDRLPGIGDPDTFFVRDLVGCAVIVGERRLGEVAEVIAGPANDVLEVDVPGAPRTLIPFTADAVRELDVSARRIVVRGDLLPEE